MYTTEKSPDALDLIDAGIDGPSEFCTETFIALFIPAIRIREVELGFRLENNPPAHFDARTRRLTSVHVEPLFG